MEHSPDVRSENLESESDARLIERFRSGDREAFEQVVARHQPAVGRLARRLCAWPSEIDDVVQEVFVRAWEKLGRFRGDSALSTWLAGITVRVCRTAHRRKLRDAQPVTDALGFVSHAGAFSLYLAESSLESAERGTRVRAAVARLSPPLREVVVLHYLEGLAPPGVAEVLRVRRGTVDMRLSRARQALRRILEKGMGDE